MHNAQTELRISTPGRVCLFGEHQDYLNLPIIASAISLRITITGHKRSDSIVIIRLPDIQDEEAFSLSEPIVHGKERDYFKSSVNVLRRHGFEFSTELECVVRGEIPINAGTSSSSALVVTWINFLTRMSDRHVELAAAQIAEYVYEAGIDNYTALLTHEQLELLRGTIRNRDITMHALKALEGPTRDDRLIGNLLNEQQLVLRDVLKISTPKIDRMIEAALSAGAYGAKINGSGGGGCIFAYAPEDPQKAKEAIEKEGGEAFIVTAVEGTRSSKVEYD